MSFKKSLCFKASSRNSKMALCDRILGRSRPVLKKMSPQNGSSFAPVKEMYVSFIFSSAERTQKWINFPEFKKHFINRNNISRNQNCWSILHSTAAKLVFCTFQKFVFDIVLYFATWVKFEVWGMKELFSIHGNFDQIIFLSVNTAG